MCGMVQNLEAFEVARASRACNIASVFLWSITPITPRCLVCSKVVICNPGKSVVHIYEVLYSLKPHKNSG